MANEEIFDLGPDDREVFALYGRMMFSVQMLEISVFQLAQLGSSAPEDPDEALRYIERLLTAPKRRQVKSLRQLPGSLRDDLLEGLGVRNKLVHQFLLEYRLMKATGEDARTWALDILRAATSFFDSVLEALDQLADRELSEAGITPTDKDAEAALLGLREWASEMVELPDAPNRSKE